MGKDNIKEIKPAEARLRTDCLIEAKIDGSALERDGSDVTSDRDCNRNARFPHVVAELRKINWHVRGEIAVPYGNVLNLTSENWPKSRFYIFGLFDVNGHNWRDAPAEDARRKLLEIFGSNSFTHLRLPTSWENFDEAWEYVESNKREGVVLKVKGLRGKEFKVKLLEEGKLPIVGLESGKAHGSFLIQSPNGEVSKASALGDQFIKDYEALLILGEQPYAEIEYPFLTPKRQVPFQPRLRRVGTMEELQTT